MGIKGAATILLTSGGKKGHTKSAGKSRKKGPAVKEKNFKIVGAMKKN